MRPLMFAGPTGRQRKAATVAESSVAEGCCALSCALSCALGAAAASARGSAAASLRGNDIGICWVGDAGRGRRRRAEHEYTPHPRASLPARQPRPLDRDGNEVQRVVPVWIVIWRPRAPALPTPAPSR